LGACRPDISLLDERGEPNVLIEIVVAHSPDENVLLFTSQRQIPLLIFRVRSAEDLEEMVASPTINPELIIHCSKRRCPECGGPLYRKALLYVLTGQCWRCGAPLNLAFSILTVISYGPDLFSDRDRRIIRQEGVSCATLSAQVTNSASSITFAALRRGTGNAYLRQLKRYEKRLFVQIPDFTAGNAVSIPTRNIWLILRVIPRNRATADNAHFPMPDPAQPEI
jgi:hypothetical protein